MITIILILLSLAFFSHANPLRTDADTLPVAPDFMKAPHLPRRPHPCRLFLHPHLGHVYGPMRGKPIYGARASQPSRDFVQACS